MAGRHFADEPWRRLPWLMPAGSLLALAALLAFLGVLARLPPQPSQPAAVMMELVELPAPAPASTPPAAVEEPPPPPPLEPSPVEPQPAEPETVVPAPVAPVPVLPPRRPPALSHPAAARPPAPPGPATAQPQAPPQAAPPPRPLPPGGGIAGARAIFKPMPELPVELRRHDVEWVARARFAVAADGSAAVELIEPTSDPHLNRLLLEALKRWRFFPALEQGRPVASTLELRIPITVK